MGFHLWEKRGGRGAKKGGVGGRRREEGGVGFPVVAGMCRRREEGHWFMFTTEKYGNSVLKKFGSIIHIEKILFFEFKF